MAAKKKPAAKRKPAAKKAKKPAQRPPSLRAVKSVKAMTVSDAAARGTQRDLLVAMRTRIATAVEDPDTPPRDLAALTKRLADVAEAIEAIDVRDAEEASVAEAEPVDESFDAAAL